MVETNFDALLASSAEVEEPVEKNMEKNRVLISFVPFSLGNFGIPYGNMAPGQLTPIVRTPWWKEFNGKRKLTAKQAANKEPMNATKEWTYPGNTVYAILLQAGNSRFGDSGVRDITCLIGLDSQARLAELQNLLLPRDLFYDERGAWKPVNLHKRVDAHLFSIIDNYDSSSVEAMAAKIILQSSQVGAAWKERVVIEAQNEVLGGHEKTPSPLQNKWRQEISAEWDDRIRMAGLHPDSKQQAIASQYAPQAPVQVQFPAEMIAAAVAAELAKMGIAAPEVKVPLDGPVASKAKGSK